MLDQVFSSLSGYLQTNPVTILPVVFVVWTFLASKILRLSWWIVNIVGIIPVLGLYFDNPFSAWIAQYDPAIFLTVAWILEFAALFGLCLGRAALGVSKAGSGVLSGLLTLLLWASALFVGALFFVPGMVEDLIPDWRASFGFVILITSLLALTIAMFRFLRASLGLLVWFAICLCIGTEVLLGKLPTDLLQSDLRNLASVLPGQLPSAMLPLEAVNPILKESDSLRVVTLGGRSFVDASSGKSETFPVILEDELRRAYPDSRVEVLNLSNDFVSVHQIANEFDSVLEKYRPNIVVLGGWYLESRSGENGFGIPGLSEREAQTQISNRRWLEYLPVVEDVLESRIVRGLRHSFLNSASAEPKAPNRVSPTEYEELIRSISNKARSAHAATILFHEPIAPWVQIESEPDYGDAIQKIANQESVVVSDVKQAFDSRKHELLFVKDNVLSARGHKLVAKTLMTTITDLRDKPEWAPVFASAGMDSSPLSHGLKWLVHGASEIGKELVFSIRFAAQGAPYFKALFSVNGEFIEDKRLETSGLQSFRFQIPERFRDKPAVSVSLQTVASPPSKEDEIGSTGIFLPVPVFIESSPAHGARISVAGRSVAQCDEQPSFVVVSIDYRNGFMRAKRNFAYAELDSMVSWLKARPWGSVVAIGSCSEVGASEFKVLSPGFSYLGYSNVPDTNSRVAFIGAAAIGSDTALVAADPNRRIEVRIGGKRLEDYSSFELAKIPEIAFVDSLS